MKNDKKEHRTIEVTNNLDNKDMTLMTNIKKICLKRYLKKLLLQNSRNHINENATQTMEYTKISPMNKDDYNFLKVHPLKTSNYTPNNEISIKLSNKEKNPIKIRLEKLMKISSNNSFNSEEIHKNCQDEKKYRCYQKKKEILRLVKPEVFRYYINNDKNDINYNRRRHYLFSVAHRHNFSMERHRYEQMFVNHQKRAFSKTNIQEGLPAIVSKKIKRGPEIHIKLPSTICSKANSSKYMIYCKNLQDL